MTKRVSYYFRPPNRPLSSEGDSLFAGCGRSYEQALDYILTRHPEMVRDVVHNSGKCSDAQGGVPRHGEVVLAVLLRRQTNVGADLPCDRISEPCQPTDQIISGDISRELHGVRIS